MYPVFPWYDPPCSYLLTWQFCQISPCCVPVFKYRASLQKREILCPAFFKLVDVLYDLKLALETISSMWFSLWDHLVTLCLCVFEYPLDWQLHHPSVMVDGVLQYFCWDKEKLKSFQRKRDKLPTWHLAYLSRLLFRNLAETAGLSVSSADGPDLGNTYWVI